MHWHDIFTEVLQQLEDGEISYCAAIDRIEDVEDFPPLSKAGLIREWTKKGCPNVRRTYSDDT